MLGLSVLRRRIRIAGEGINHTMRRTRLYGSWNCTKVGEERDIGSPPDAKLEDVARKVHDPLIQLIRVEHFREDRGRLIKIEIVIQSLAGVTGDSFSSEIRSRRLVPCLNALDSDWDGSGSVCSKLLSRRDDVPHFRRAGTRSPIETSTGTRPLSSAKDLRATRAVQWTFTACFASSLRLGHGARDERTNGLFPGDVALEPRCLSLEHVIAPPARCSVDFRVRQERRALSEMARGEPQRRDIGTAIGLGHYRRHRLLAAQPLDPSRRIPPSVRPRI